MSKLLVASVLCLLVATGARAAPTANKASAAKPAPAADAPLVSTSPIATIDGQTIPYSEIERAIGAQVRQAEAEYLTKAYDLRRGALDQLITNRLLEGEARKAGKTVAEWLDQEFLAKVPEPTEDELRKAYEKNRAQLEGATFEQVKDRLREHLRRLEAKRRFQARLQELMTKHGVKTFLVAPEPVRFAVEAAGPSRGAEKAKVTIVEFSDFQCPYCGRVSPTLARVLADYQGKVRLFYRQFPLGFHPLAQKAAEASLCANDQGKFWELHDRMFADQSKLEVADLKAAARTLGLDGAKFDACLDGGSKAAAVEADLRAGQAVGVQGTPALFVNGVFINGAAPYEQVKAVVDRELERE